METNIVKTNRQEVAELLERYRGQFEQALPKFLTPERLIRVALTAMAKQPKLFECTKASLVGSILTSAQLGLMPDGVLGEAYLIPYKNSRNQTTECQYIIGYRGLCALALRSGQVKSIQARAVKAGDKFEYQFGLESKLLHQPGDPAQPITHFYSVIELMTGGNLYDVMTVSEVNFIRDKSPNYAFARDKARSVWGEYYEEMGKKTVLRRLMKFSPLSPDINMAVGLDEQAEVIGESQKIHTSIIDLPEAAEIVEEVPEDLPEEEALKEELKKASAKKGQDLAERVESKLNISNATAPEK